MKDHRNEGENLKSCQTGKTSLGLLEYFRLITLPIANYKCGSMVVIVTNLLPTHRGLSSIHFVNECLVECSKHERKLFLVKR